MDVREGDLRVALTVSAPTGLDFAAMSPRRFPPPWRVEQIPGGYKVLDASGQALAYVYATETKAEADTAKVLTFDEARRIAANVAKLQSCLNEGDGNARL
jgi:hypothetical protein